MERLTATFELVTPAFAGGPETSDTDGLRIPALKALIRFWWRVMQTSRILHVSDLRRAEAEVFGSADGRVGRCLSMSAGTIGPRQVNGPGTEERDATYTYMAYGPVTWNKKTRRPELTVPRIRPGHEVDVRFAVYGRDPLASRDQLAKALWLLSAFGGYGGRSRRGWGSLMVRGLEADWKTLGLADPHACRDRKGLADVLGTGLGVCHGPRQMGSTSAALAYTGLSREARVVLGPVVCTDWKAALDSAAKVYMRYRRALGAERAHGPRIGPDFQLRDRWSRSGRLSPGDTSPRGSSFGLPHFAKHDVKVGVGEKFDGRRASPLFIKILKCNQSQQAIPLFVWMPAAFLGGGHAIHIHAPSFGTATPPVPSAGDGPIQEFFDGATISQGTEPPVNWRSLAAQGWLEVAW